MHALLNPVAICAEWLNADVVVSLLHPCLDKAFAYVSNVGATELVTPVSLKFFIFFLNSFF